jgi:hypothetical protein
MEFNTAIEDLQRRATKALAINSNEELAQIYSDLASLFKAKQLLSVPSSEARPVHTEAETISLRDIREQLFDGCYSGAVDSLFSLEVRIDSIRGIISADVRNNRK